MGIPSVPDQKMMTEKVLLQHGFSFVWLKHICRFTYIQLCSLRKILAETECPIIKITFMQNLESKKNKRYFRDCLFWVLFINITLFRPFYSYFTEYKRIFFQTKCSYWRWSYINQWPNQQIRGVSTILHPSFSILSSELFTSSSRSYRSKDAPTEAFWKCWANV